MTTASVASDATPDGLHFAAPHPLDGRAIRYHFDEYVIDLVGRLTERMAVEGVLAALEPHMPTSLVRAYLGQCLYLELLDTARSLYRFRFLANQGARVLGHLACPRALHSILRPELDDLPGVRLCDSHGLGYRALRAVWRQREKVRRSRVTVSSNRAPATFRGPCVAIEAVEGADIHVKSDAFWLASGLVDPAQVLFVFERHNAGLIDPGQQQDLIDALGARSVALHPAVSAQGRIPIWVPPTATPAWAKSAHSILAGARSSVNTWVYQTLLQGLERVVYWESFYRAYSVGIAQNFTELTADTLAKRIAIDRIGGVEMGKMRSEIFERSGAAFHFKHEIACVWHGNVMPMLSYSKSLPARAIETGYVYDHLFTERVAAAAELRQSLQRRGVTRVIAAFDNAAHRNGHVSARQLEAFYRCLADVVQKRQDVGVILKPKKQIRAEKYRRIQRLAKFPGLAWLAKRYPLEMPDIEDAMSSLRESGRCIELTGVKANVIDAGLAADVIASIPSSTAACEAALAGRRLVMYDPSAACGNPVCAAPHRTSFRTIDAFRARLDFCLDEAPSNSQDEVALAQLDPIRDGRAAHRVGAFIATYLDHLGAGQSKPQCLEAATSALAVQGGRLVT